MCEMLENPNLLYKYGLQTNYAWQNTFSSFYRV